MSRLVPIGASEQAEVMARVEAHLAAGGQLIELPRYVLHATAGVCPGRNLPSLQAWIGPRTAAVALEERVDVAQIVSARVLAVLKELDRLTEVGAAVDAGQKSFDDVASAQIEPRDPTNGFRMQKSFGSGHRSSIRPL